MRINKFVARATGMSRRSVDIAVMEARVTVNGVLATAGQQIEPSDQVALDGRSITPAVKTLTLILNKPPGYVVSRDGQGSPTVYDLLPAQYHRLKPVGRLDKDSSGLLLMTSDGNLAHRLTHPSFQKEKVYEVKLNKPLEPADRAAIESGVELDDGISRLSLSGNDSTWTVTMSEGRNRQIRRTFSDRGYTVVTLHRTRFGDYQLQNLTEGKYLQV